MRIGDLQAVVGVVERESLIDALDGVQHHLPPLAGFLGEGVALADADGEERDGVPHAAEFVARGLGQRDIGIAARDLADRRHQLAKLRQHRGQDDEGEQRAEHDGDGGDRQRDIGAVGEFREHLDPRRVRLRAKLRLQGDEQRLCRLALAARLGEERIADDALVVGIGVHRLHRRRVESVDGSADLRGLVGQEGLQPLEFGIEAGPRLVAALLGEGQQAHREIGAPIEQLMEVHMHGGDDLRDRRDAPRLVERAGRALDGPEDIGAGRRHRQQKHHRQHDRAGGDRGLAKRADQAVEHGAAHGSARVMLMTLERSPSAAPSRG